MGILHSNQSGLALGPLPVSKIFNKNWKFHNFRAPMDALILSYRICCGCF